MGGPPLPLVSRPALFVAFQGLAAVALAVRGHAAPWSATVAGTASCCACAAAAPPVTIGLAEMPTYYS